jgi:hypothetical protein
MPKHTLRVTVATLLIAGGTLLSAGIASADACFTTPTGRVCLPELAPPVFDPPAVDFPDALIPDAVGARPDAAPDPVPDAAPEPVADAVADPAPDAGAVPESGSTSARQASSPRPASVVPGNQPDPATRTQAGSTQAGNTRGHSTEHNEVFLGPLAFAALGSLLLLGGIVLTILVVTVIVRSSRRHARV